MSGWDPFAEQERKTADTVRVSGVDLRAGDRVRLRPRKNADVMDLALEGRVAEIESIEVDYDDQVHLAVTLDDDPGRDLGKLRQPGHRFFFGVEEVEPVTPGILVAGIGNIFLRDDAFGCEAVRKLLERPLPSNVKVFDYGVRGFDLAFALLEKLDSAILVDAAPRGNAPGTLYTIEVDTEAAGQGVAGFEGHGMNPARVLSMVHALGGTRARVFLVGCEPSPVESGDEEGMGLSEPVLAALDGAVTMIESLVSKLIAGNGGELCPEYGRC
jgi:hydrogenase maturation protease